MQLYLTKVQVSSVDFDSFARSRKSAVRIILPSIIVSWWQVGLGAKALGDSGSVLLLFSVAILTNGRNPENIILS